MGEESRQLKDHIDFTRDELDRNIDRFQAKVKHTFDWREQFQDRPMTMIGVAFGAGILLSALMSSGSSRAEGEFEGEARRSERGPNARKAEETWDRIKGALVGVAAVKAQSFLDEVVPGFRKEYEKVEAERGEQGRTRVVDSAAA